MKPLIINVRGTSGSGKTHLTREWMKQFDSNPIWESRAVSRRPKVLGYNAEKFHKDGRHEQWFVIGSYENVCGGCDTIKTQQEIIDRVGWAISQGYNVWLEGLILSTIYGLVGAYSEEYADRWLFAYLNTPVDVCVERVIERRRVAGNIKPFDTENTVKRHATIQRNRAIVEEKGREAVTVDYLRPLASINNIIRKRT